MRHGVREFREEDIPAVVHIHMRTERQHNYPDLLAEYFRDVYLKSPLYDPELPSLVYEARDGQVIGFMGRLGRRMWFREHKIRGALVRHLMVDPDRRGGRAGLTLTRGCTTGPDLSIGDTANDLGRNAAVRVGGCTVAASSFTWTYVLRPGSFLAVRAAERIKAARMVLPLGKVADNVVRRLFPERFQVNPPELQAEDPDAKTLTAWLREVSSKKAVRPDYDPTTEAWLLERAALNRRFGTLKKVLLRGVAGEVAGSYVYYAQPGGVSHVVQLAACEGRHELVLDHLLHTAGKEGTVAISGRVQVDWLPALARRRCLTEIGPWFAFVTPHEDVKRCLLAGDFFFPRLDGEWSTGFPRPQ